MAETAMLPLGGSCHGPARIPRPALDSALFSSKLKSHPGQRFVLPKCFHGFRPLQLGCSHGCCQLSAPPCSFQHFCLFPCT